MLYAEELISLAARRSKAKQARVNELTTRISTLERTHKASLAASSLAELTQVKKELLDELNGKLKRKFALTQKLFYEFSNKSGKLLARALQARELPTLFTKSKTPPVQPWLPPKTFLINSSVTSPNSTIFPPHTHPKLSLSAQRFSRIF